jgi:hypothetical protein
MRNELSEKKRKRLRHNSTGVVITVPEKQPYLPKLDSGKSSPFLSSTRKLLSRFRYATVVSACMRIEETEENGRAIRSTVWIDMLENTSEVAPSCLEGSC